MMKNVAIVGTQGVPACYGGFETLVENIIGENCSPNIKYTVFCSSKDLNKSNHPSTYKGVNLKYVPLHANGMQSIMYDIVSLIRVMFGYDNVVVLGVSGCLFLPIFRLFYHKRLIINIDGLEHKRDKWGKLARWVLKTSEKMAVRFADTVIADNKGIQDYVRDTYAKASTLIAYGGDHVKNDIPEATQKKVLEKYNLTKNNYAITVCRIEPENNCHLTLEAFAQSNKKLIFIGNWNHSEYGKSLKEKYSNRYNIKMLDAIYDLDILYSLRRNAGMYIHGHSAGGTNPSLVEAMFFGIPILCFDVVYNRETTKNKAYYWHSVNALKFYISSKDLNGVQMLEIARKEYTWKQIASQYEALYR